MKRAREVIELHSSAEIGLCGAWIAGNDLRTPKRDRQCHIRLDIIGQRERHPSAVVEQPLTVDHVEKRIIFPPRRLEALRLDAPSDGLRSRPWAEDASIHDPRERFTINFRIDRHVAEKFPRPLEELSLLAQVLA